MKADSTNVLKLKIRLVLNRASSILFPLQKQQIEKLVKLHTWRDQKYVGEVGGKVCV